MDFDDPRSELEATPWDTDTRRGDVEAGLAEAEVIHEATYTTAANTNNPLGLFATVAGWEGDTLTVHDATQWPAYAQATIAGVLGIEPSAVRVHAPYVGGAFGAGLFVWQHVILTVLAARAVGRPVKLVLTRPEMSTGVGPRPSSVQTIRMGARRDGELVAIEHVSTNSAAIAHASIEPITGATARSYACANVATTDRQHGRLSMGTITTTDGTEIFFKDWGSGQPIVFSHGWPLSGDDWDTQMLFLLQNGYRVIAHDRRGHGRSTQTSDGHDMDHYADDLAALTAHLDLQDAVHVGHSTGGGEVAHYIARHGESRVAKAVLISAVPPLMVQTDANPGGLPKSVFDDLQSQLARTGPSPIAHCHRDPSTVSMTRNGIRRLFTASSAPRSATTAPRPSPSQPLPTTSHGTYMITTFGWSTSRQRVAPRRYVSSPCASRRATSRTLRSTRSGPLRRT